MLVFLKLGGSLITDKSRPYTARPDTLSRLAQEIASACREQVGLSLVIGHGSGSFGHTAANRFKTRDGVFTPFDWLGFSEVWKEARALNEIVMNAFLNAGLPVIAFPPSSSVVTKNHRILGWDLDAMQLAIIHGMIPVVNGDVIFDTEIGGTILSTEEAFCYMAPALKPERILLAGIEPGVWQDLGTRQTVYPHITPVSYQTSQQGVSGSQSVDVTGGMAQKVASMLGLLDRLPTLKACIFSGEETGLVYRALSGENPGTLISLDQEAV